MESIPCPACNTFFVPRNKSQEFCSNSKCQRARKALWQKQKLATDPDYEAAQRLSNNKWFKNNPEYWKNYRTRNPKKAERNRSLQTIRNMKKRENQDSQSSKHVVIAKMDSGKCSKDKLSGEYWFVPTNAKMDARKIFITCVPGNSP